MNALGMRTKRAKFLGMRDHSVKTSIGTDHMVGASLMNGVLQPQPQINNDYSSASDFTPLGIKEKKTSSKTSLERKEKHRHLKEQGNSKFT